MPRDPTKIWLELLATKRAPALAAALPLVRAGRFDEAERLVLDADDSIHGSVALARLYTDELRRLVSEGAAAACAPGRDHAEQVFRRALGWRLGCYPEPHTSIEAESNESGRAADRAELVAIIGADPT